MAVGSAHLAHITRCPHPSPPSCCWTPTPSVEWTRWSNRWHQRASRRPRKGRPTTLPPSLHPHHPILPPCKATHTCLGSTGWVWRAPPPFTHPHHHTSHLSHSPRWRCHRSVGTTPHYLADQHWPLPPQTHAGHIPHHALSRPPLQAQGGGEAANRQCGPGILAQVRVNRSGPRVVRAVGRRAPVCCLGLCCACGVSTALTLNFFIPHPRRPALERVPTDASGQGCGYRCRRISRSLGCCA